MADILDTLDFNSGPQSRCDELTKGLFRLAAEEIRRQQTRAHNMRRELDRLRQLDAEAATHVESVIALRTGFTGKKPYVGWKGLGLALREALDERDALRPPITGEDLAHG